MQVATPEVVKLSLGVAAVLGLSGFTAAVAQIILLRELLVLFCGNEISLGLMLASWLLWTAAGVGLATRFAGDWQRPRRRMAATLIWIAVALPATVLAARAAKGLLQNVPGELLGPGTMLLTSVVVLGPLCLLSGSLFACGSRLVAKGTSDAAEAGSAVYLWEAAGSAVGGLLAGLLLVQYFGALQIALWLALLNLLAACSLAIATPRPRRAAIAGVLAIAATLAVLHLPQAAETASERQFWRGQHLLATRNSLYGSLAIVGDRESRTVYENGAVLFHVPDPAAAEEAVHFALLEHPHPRSLLLIGGGLNGSIAQALRHPSIERIDYVELDSEILRLARDYFPAEWRVLQTDPRVHLHVADGRLFLRTTRARFDVVIVNSPDPQSAQLNRFYTAEFFREASRKLTDTGLLALQLHSSENYISPELGHFLLTIRETLSSVFPQVRAIPGETVHFFGAKRPGVLAHGAEELLARLRERHLRTDYVSEYFLPYRMSPDRMLELEGGRQPGIAINRDFAPVAYYFDVALWSSQFGDTYRRFFRALSAVPYSAVLLTTAILLAALFLRRRRARSAAACCTAATGFTGMAMEMLLLLGFQAVHGYVYQQLAVLIAAYMLGIALGLGLRDVVCSWRKPLPHGRGSEPEPRASEPAPRASEPALRASEPAPRASEPEPRAFEPEPRAFEPEPRASEPAPGASEPEPRASEPALRASEPAPRASEPALPAFEPELRASEPEPRASEPEPRASEPALRASEPAPRAFEPAPRAFEPEPRASEPEPRASASGSGIAQYHAVEDPGGSLALRSSWSAHPRTLGIVQILIAAAPLVLMTLLRATGQLVFPALAAAAGLLGGFQFAVANRVFCAQSKAAHARGPGLLYALDLTGSCLGAILVSVWLIPIFGFLATALLSTLISLAPAAVALLAAPAADQA